MCNKLTYPEVMPVLSDCVDVMHKRNDGYAFPCGYLQALTAELIVRLSEYDKPMADRILRDIKRNVES